MGASGVPVPRSALERSRQFPTLVDIATVADLLGVEIRFVRRLVFERRIPYVKVGRYVRFDVTAVARWVDDRRVDEEQPAVWRGRR